MAIMNTGNFPQDLRPGIRMWFGAAYKMWDTKYDKMFDVKIPDDRAYEEDVMLSTLGLAQVKSQGAPVTYDSGNQLYTSRLTHIQYGLGFVLTEEMREDGVALKMAEEFSNATKLSMLRSREIISAAGYANGFSSNPGIDSGTGDGVNLFASTHPTPAGNQSNVPTTPATLSEASLEQMINDIRLFKDNRGQIIDCMPDKIIIPVQLQFTAERILKSVLRSGTNDNDVNAIRNMGYLPGGVLINPYLTSTTNWFVRTNQPGAVFFNRKDISMSDDNEFDTENLKMKALMRFSVGVTDWRSVYGVNA